MSRFICLFVFIWEAVALSFSPPATIRLPGGEPYSYPLAITGNDTSDLGVNLTSTVPFGFYTHPNLVTETTLFEGCDYFLTLGCGTVLITGNLSAINAFLAAFVLDMGVSDGRIWYRVTNGTGDGLGGEILILLSYTTGGVSSSTPMEVALLGGLSALVAVLCLLSVMFIVLIRQRARAFFSRQKKVLPVVPSKV